MTLVIVSTVESLCFGFSGRTLMAKRTGKWIHRVRQSQVWLYLEWIIERVSNCVYALCVEQENGDKNGNFVGEFS